MPLYWRGGLALVLGVLALQALRADECDDRDGAPCDTGQLGICVAGKLHCHDDELRCERLEGPRGDDCDNGRDDDCDGTVDARDGNCGCPDADNDDWAVCSEGCAPRDGDQCGDCDDQRGDVNPDRSENCGNDRDDDCDGAVDAQDGSCAPPACPDRDNDGWADCSGGCAPRGGGPLRRL